MSTTEQAFTKGVAIVTGGSGVIGSAIARKLAAMGSNVALTYHSNATAAQALADEIKKAGRDATASKVDVVDAGAMQAFVDEAALRFGAIHSVVYASGPRIMLKFVNQVDPAEWAQAVDADVKGCFNLVAATLPKLRAQKSGSYLAVLTAAVDRSPPRDILSAAPKAAIQMLVRSVALEEGRNGLRANCIAPGFIPDGIGISMIGSDAKEFSERMVKAIPMKRAGTPDEMAEAACFLLSSKAGYITGSTLHVAGGLQLA